MFNKFYSILRESRAELRKHLRKIKKLNPDATCFMQYDKLYVNNKIYVYNDLQGKVVVPFRSQMIAMITQIFFPKVVEQNQVEDPIAMSLASLVMSRPGSVMDDRPGSSMSMMSGMVVNNTPKTPNKSRTKLRNAVSMNSVECKEDTPSSGSGDRIRELEYQLSVQQENFSTRMKDMEKIIRKQEEMLEKLKMTNGHNHVNGDS